MLVQGTVPILCRVQCRVECLGGPPAWPPLYPSLPPRTLLMPVQGTVSGMPARIAAWVAGAWPRLLLHTLPMKTSSTADAGMCARCRAATWGGEGMWRGRRRHAGSRRQEGEAEAGMCARRRAAAGRGEGKRGRCRQASQGRRGVHDAGSRLKTGMTSNKTWGHCTAQILTALRRIWQE